jgi:hypothetical protein
MRTIPLLRFLKNTATLQPTPGKESALLCKKDRENGRQRKPHKIARQFAREGD